MRSGVIIASPLPPLAFRCTSHHSGRAQRGQELPAEYTKYVVDRIWCMVYNLKCSQTSFIPIELRKERGSASFANKFVTSIWYLFPNIMTIHLSPSPTSHTQRPAAKRSAAIVSPIPGTTRDIVETCVVWMGHFGAGPLCVSFSWVHTNWLLCCYSSHVAGFSTYPTQFWY